jgi:adenylate cyclase
MPRTVWAEAVHRRVPHVVGFYLAAGWGVLEFISWAADRAVVPDRVVDVVFLIWVLLLPLAAYLAWRGFAPLRERPATPDQPSVAVLPFAVHGGGPGSQHLADGLADEITTALARVPGLRVASRTSTRAAATRITDLRQLGSDLQVGAVLEGELQRSGDRLRVSTRLVDVDDGYQLWSDRYDGPMSDVFAIEDAISHEVVAGLEVLVRESGLRTLRPTRRTDVRAYEYYLRGRQFFHQTRRKSLGFARSMFRRALAVDPDYAPAHAALADAIALERTYYPTSDVDLAEAERASRRSLEIDPELPEGHAARGHVLFIQRRFEEAEAAFRTAIRLDARLPEPHYFLARMLFQLGRFEEAAREFDAANAVRPDHRSAFFAGQAYEALGWEDPALERYRDAVDRVAEHMELNPDDPRAATIRAVALHRIGRRGEALEWGQRAIEIDPDDGGVRYNVACLYAVAGEADRALEALEMALAAGFGNPEWLDKDPDLSTVRDHPRFRALVAAHSRSPSDPHEEPPEALTETRRNGPASARP